MKKNLKLFLRGFISAVCLFLLMNLGRFDELSVLSISGILIGSMLIGYCSMRFAPRFWKDFGFDEKASR